MSPWLAHQIRQEEAAYKKRCEEAGAEYLTDRQRGARDERAACAELVRAAGCLCGRSKETSPDGWIDGLDAVEYEPCDIPEPLRVKIHHPQCPQGLAAAIEARA